LSVYSAIERTPAAHAFVRALDRRFGPEASNIKRAEHAFTNTAEVEDLIAGQGFERVIVATATKHKVPVCPRLRALSVGGYADGCSIEWVAAARAR
jgi:hypothetical protein